MTPHQRHFTMEDLHRLAGEGDQDMQARSQSGNVPVYQLPPAQRDIRREICSVVYAAGDWIDRAGIAKALKLTASEWLINHIEKLVTEGYLIKYETPYRPGMTKKWYRINS